MLSYFYIYNFASGDIANEIGLEAILPTRSSMLSDK